MLKLATSLPVVAGVKLYGKDTMAAKGHEFGLRLSGEEREALIAFLRTL